MSQEQESVAADVTADNISDSQLDKFFESGGKDLVEPEQHKQEETQEPQQAQVEPDKEHENVEQQKENEQRNYKAAMHEEREKRKEIQRELQETKQRAQRIEETFQQFQNRVFQSTAPQPPSYEDNPLEALKYRQENIEQALNQQNEIERSRQQDATLSKQFNGFVSRYQQDAKEFEQVNPDFKEAYNYVREDKRKELSEAGYSSNEVMRLLMEDEMAVVAKAFNDNANPAERIYKIAKIRGFQKKQQSQQSVVEQANQKLDQVEKGAQMSRSISDARGKSPESSVTLESLSRLSEEELDEYIGSSKNWNQIGKMMR